MISRLTIVFESIVMFAVSFISLEVSKLSEDDLTALLSIFAQILIIIYALIKILKEKPLDIKKVISLVYDAITLLFNALKIIFKAKASKAFKRARAKNKIDEINKLDEELKNLNKNEGEN